ncbi:MAG: hypothetical protein H8E68_07445 [Kiritimatiellaeota bacterium]|nr:hypothetical protein [Kiritimatiellota bacterium]
MNLLLDTRAYLWFIAGDERLSAVAREAIENPSHLKIISVASLWEITIKNSLGNPLGRAGCSKTGEVVASLP